MSQTKSIPKLPSKQEQTHLRICSLIPSGTELAFALGLGEEVLGVTSFCNYPPEARNKWIVSRGVIMDLYNRREKDIDNEVQTLAKEGRPAYTLDINWLNTTKPNLILTQDMCNSCDARANDVACATEGFDANILVLNAHFIDDIFRNIRQLADAAEVPRAAELLTRNLKTRIREVTRKVSNAPNKPTVVFLEWLDPPSPAGDWYPEMVELAGGIPMMSTKGGPPTKMSWSDIKRCNPEYIIVSPCSHPLKRSLAEMPEIAENDDWQNLEAVRQGNFYIIESEYFERPGPRIVNGIEILAQILHPELVSGKVPQNLVIKLKPQQRKPHSEAAILQAFEPYPLMKAEP